jgi:hypothetical protein
MEIIERGSLEKLHLPGRAVQKAVGKDARSASLKMSMGFARYSEASGPMETHQHAEEIVYIVSAQDGWLRWGSDPEALGTPIPLQEGHTLHIPELEWHVFGFGPGGHVDIIFFYGQVDNIRPEEIER